MPNAGVSRFNSKTHIPVLRVARPAIQESRNSSIPSLHPPKAVNVAFRSLYLGELVPAFPSARRAETSAFSGTGMTIPGGREQIIRQGLLMAGHTARTRRQHIAISYGMQSAPCSEAP